MAESDYSKDYKRKYKEETGEEFRDNNPYRGYVDSAGKSFGGKHTVLDLVREVKKDDDRYIAFGGKDRVLMEEAPTAGGTYKGSVYYSNILPQGQDKTPWSKRGSMLVRNAAQPNAKKKDILAVQNYFADIGYMHPSEIDGDKGKQVMGMIRRWNLNAGTSKDAMFDAMKNWKDNLFDGGAEEFEEDLREGGGDQGPY